MTDESVPTMPDDPAQPADVGAGGSPDAVGDLDDDGAAVGDVGALDGVGTEADAGDDDGLEPAAE